MRCGAGEEAFLLLRLTHQHHHQLISLPHFSVSNLQSARLSRLHLPLSLFFGSFPFWVFGFFLFFPFCCGSSGLGGQRWMVNLCDPKVGRWQQMAKKDGIDS
jgi:hypothetical protein